MRFSVSGTKACLWGSVLLLACPVPMINADAAQPNAQNQPVSQNRPDAQTHTDAYREPLQAPTATYPVHPVTMRLTFDSSPMVYQTARARKPPANAPAGISCVPYARAVSGIQVTGNAWQWWTNAKGLYARGDQPESGSVLNFRPNGRMELGHVAVVKRVVNAREVIVDHANWANGGRVTRNVAVVDVSEANNWSAVRVELGRSGEFGSIYPTYGFIYKRPDTGMVLSSIARPAPQPEINPVPSDLRPAAERPWRTVVEEVAEAPGEQPHRLETRPNTIARVR